MCDCGIHEDLLADKSNHFTIDVSRCPICADVARWQRIQGFSDDRHRKALGDDPPANRRDPEDGRRVHIRRMTPEEVAARKATAEQ